MVVQKGVTGMGYKIGFAIGKENEEKQEDEVKMERLPGEKKTVKKSVVQVKFDGYGRALAYYNDSFDLQVGDLVFVDGKLCGKQGVVTEVNYNFKIKLSEYQKVVSVADTEVKGNLYFAGSHFVAFEKSVLPREKVKAWFMPPENEEEYVSGTDDTSFFLENLQEMNVRQPIAERGHEYYRQNRVRYICIDGTEGYAVVEGENHYEVEFTYDQGEISGLTCNCLCSYTCKHEVATMLQLKETLGYITEKYEAEYEESGYFAAICKTTLFRYAMDGEKKGCLRLGE